ncbi:hypothetical protein H2248_002895 [Termitomyces sp. 'cryptogamus']|nr:hypothetical protein H2248_002895 [Termitomyces sp. 'cryptogamus']
MARVLAWIKDWQEAEQDKGDVGVVGDSSCGGAASTMLACSRITDLISFLGFIPLRLAYYDYSIATIQFLSSHPFDRNYKIPSLYANPQFFLVNLDYVKLLRRDYCILT